MYLVRIGYRALNLEYLIDMADSATGAPADVAPPGGIRLSVFPGRILDVEGDDAVDLRRHIARLVVPAPRDVASDPAQEVKARATIGRGVPPRTSALARE